MGSRVLTGLTWFTTTIDPLAVGIVKRPSGRPFYAPSTDALKQMGSSSTWKSSTVTC